MEARERVMALKRKIGTDLPSTRSPVDTNETGKRWPVLFLLDASGSMQPYLTAALQVLRGMLQVIAAHPVASACIEVAILLIHDSRVQCLRDFALTPEIPDVPLDLLAGGETPLASALVTALAFGLDRKARIQEAFPDAGNYAQPLLILASDMRGTESGFDGFWSDASAIVRDLQAMNPKRIGVVKYLVQDADRSVADRLPGAAIPALDPEDFAVRLNELFKELMASISPSRLDAESPVAGIVRSDDAQAKVDDELNRILLDLFDGEDVRVA